jgi:hypothetical protein
MEFHKIGVRLRFFMEWYSFSRAVRHDPARFEIVVETRRSPVGGKAVAGLRYHALWRDTLRQSALGNELRSSDHVDLVNRALSPQSSLIYWFLAWASGCATGGGASLRLDAHSGLFHAYRDA